MTNSVPPQEPTSPYDQAPMPGQAPRRSGGLFPFPHRTFQTRGGSQVSVGGCCLPIPLMVLATAGVAARAIVRGR